MMELRVTSVRQQGKLKAIFAGVPISADKMVRDARQVIVVHTPSSNLPIELAKGQCWKVEWNSTTRNEIERNGFRFTEVHVYAKKLELTLPHDGENFIRFVAQNPDFKGIGEVKARELWSAFGDDLYPIIQRKDDDKLTPFLSDTSIQALYDGWGKYSNLRHMQWFLRVASLPISWAACFVIMGMKPFRLSRLTPSA